MKRSSLRILTTHIGSLPRPKALWEFIAAKDQNQPYDHSALDTQLKSAVRAIVRKQIEAGIDIPSDGEQSKASFTNYVRERLRGLEGIQIPRSRPSHAGLHGGEREWWAPPSQSESELHHAKLLRPICRGYLKVSQKFRLNYGIRWNPFIPMQFTQSDVSDFSLSNFYAGKRSTVVPTAPPGFTYPGDPGFNGRSGLDSNFGHPEPRVGFAWDPTGSGKTAIRGGSHLRRRTL